MTAPWLEHRWEALPSDPAEGREWEASRGWGMGGGGGSGERREGGASRRWGMVGGAGE